MRLPRSVSYAQLRAACKLLGVPENAGIQEVRIAFGGDSAGMTVGVLARNRTGEFVTDADDEPLTAYGHIPVGPAEEVTADAAPE